MSPAGTAEVVTGDAITHWAGLLEEIAASDDWRADLYHEAEHAQDDLPRAVDGIVRRALVVLDQLAQQAEIRAFRPGQRSAGPAELARWRQELRNCVVELRGAGKKL